MRFCPFCAAENADDATHCASCGARLPAMRRKAAPTVEPTPTPTVVDPSLNLVDVSPSPSPLPPPPKGHVVGVSATLPLKAEAAQAVVAAEKVLALREPSQRVELHPEAKVAPMPDPPEGGLVAYPRYALAVWRARYERRVATRELVQEIKADVAALDAVLGALGREVRAQGIVIPGLADETRLIQEAETRRIAAEQVATELREKTTEENTKFASAKERVLEKLAAGHRAVEDAGVALDAEEGKRKALREKRKELERRYRDLLKRAAERESQAEKQPTEQRQALRVSAEDLRKEAKQLEPERIDLDRQLAGAEKPIEEARSRLTQAKNDVDDTRQALDDVEAGHRQRLTELEAELSHQQSEAAQGKSEVSRRIVTLGTLVNLHRLDRPALTPHYVRVDELKVALASKEADIERLSVERNQVDRAAMVRGVALISGAFVLVATLITVLIALI